jgi:cyclic lactone autoinducer peptide
MTDFWSIVASLIETIANLGAGAASNGFGYEPDLPIELRK